VPAEAAKNDRMNMTTLNSSIAAQRARPIQIAHFVVKTRRFKDVVQWYKEFFESATVFESDELAFFTYDDEHHRYAIISEPGVDGSESDRTGIDHIAFAYSTMADLIYNYERLKEKGILPFVGINHGPTTSLYFHDPDGVQVEIQVDNHTALGGPHDFFKTQTFARNPVGVEFDPDLLSEKFHAGVPDQELMLQGSAPVKPGSEYLPIPDGTLAS
jgi:catechol 2,3-dioxygenase-like lactoylglutathione lyase family enzyme